MNNKVITYSDNGQICSIVRYNRNGQMNGLLEKFWDDGSLHYSINYIDGKPNGIFKEFRSNGEFWHSKIIE